MRKLFLFLSLGIFLFSCKEVKKETKPSPYQPLADQYAEFPLTTDLNQLTENEKKMLPILIEVANIMEDIFWQNAYGDKNALMAQFAQDSAALKYLSINYGPWDRLNDNKPFIDGVGAKPLGANFYPADMTKEEFDSLDDPRKTDWYSVIRRDAAGKLIVLSFHEAYPKEVAKASKLLEEAAELAEDPGLKNYLALRSKALLDDDYLASDLAWMDMQNNTLDFVVGPIETYEDQLYGYKAAHSGQILVKDKEWSKRLSEYAQYLPKLQENLPVPAKYKKENLKNEEKTNKKNTSSAQAKKIRKLKKEIDSGQVSLFYDQQLREYTDKKNFYDYCVLRLKKIKEWLNTFTPFNEQEQVDCQYIRQFLEEEENLLLRDNVKMHFTASAWVLNPSKNKVLMLYHNIYQSWSWSGGHADREGDLLSVAMKEVKEESGLVSLKPLSDSPISIEILGVQPHYKKQKYVSAHLHLNYTFLLHNIKEEKLKICPEENSKVGWLSPDEAVRSSTEAWMKPIYKKLNQKMRKYLG